MHTHHYNCTIVQRLYHYIMYAKPYLLITILPSCTMIWSGRRARNRRSCEWHVDIRWTQQGVESYKSLNATTHVRSYLTQLNRTHTARPILLN